MNSTSPQSSGKGTSKKQTSARDWADSFDLPGKASDFISHADVLEPGTRVFHCCRVSRYKQKWTENLDDQLRNLRTESDRRGFVEIGFKQETTSGWKMDWLIDPARKAIELGAVLLAETTDRFVRHPDFNSTTNPNAQARTCDLEKLCLWTGGVSLCTIVHPDASPEEVRSYQTIRGQKQKNRKGGRPKQLDGEERYRICMPMIRELHREGHSSRSIADQLTSQFNTPISHMTIRRWLKSEL